MARQPLDTVRSVLKGYADRGVFRSFSERPAGRGKTEFKFIWLAEGPFELLFDEKSATLRFRDLLGNMPARSDLYAGVKSFVKERSDPSLPAHRRIDSKRADLICSNRSGNVSIGLKVRNNQFTYGARKSVSLVSEIFQNLLYEPLYYEYMVANFELDQE